MRILNKAHHYSGRGAEPGRIGRFSANGRPLPPVGNTPLLCGFVVHSRRAQLDCAPADAEHNPAHGVRNHLYVGADRALPNPAQVGLSLVVDDPQQTTTGAVVANVARRNDRAETASRHLGRAHPSRATVFIGPAKEPRQRRAWRYDAMSTRPRRIDDTPRQRAMLSRRRKCTHF